jgi:murein L,D-transpeptidase YcbB/YkuD
MPSRNPAPDYERRHPTPLAPELCLAIDVVGGAGRITMRQVVALSVISVLSLGTAFLTPIPARANPEAAVSAAAEPVAASSESPTEPQPAVPQAKGEEARTGDEPVAAKPATTDEPVAAEPITTDEPVAAKPVTTDEPVAAKPNTTDEQVAASPSPEQIQAESVRAAVGGPIRGIVDNAKDVEALRTFYAARNNAPVFIRPDGPTDKMRAAISRLNAADQDGLDAGDYRTPAIDGISPENLVRAELALMSAVLKYARHAQSGRVDPSRISVNIAFTPPVPDSLQVLNTIAEAADVAAVLNNFNPPHAGFQELRTKLRELRAKPDSVKPESIAAAGTKSAGTKSARNKPASTKADGGKPDFSKANTIESVIANMERWRWLPRDLGDSHVLVNIPDYTLTVMRGGQRAFHTRIVIGKKETPSPVFSDEIETVQVNPTWHVPPAILARNPGLVGRGDFVVSRRADGSIGASQRPGPQNALGQIKINFPNPFLVYLHDTPDKNLFKLDKRAYSSGCMRVENPDQFAAQVLSIGGAEGNYTAAKLNGLYNKGERLISLTTRLPIHLVYMNAYVADGQLVVKPDIYDYDARVRSALKGRYLVVQERSQRGSSVPRAARTVSPHQPYRTGQWPAYTGGRGLFGFF